LPARCRVETEADLRDDRLKFFSLTSDGRDKVGSKGSFSNGVNVEVRMGGSRGAREDRNLRCVNDSATCGSIEGKSGRDDEGAGLGEGKVRALSPPVRARKGLSGIHSVDRDGLDHTSSPLIDWGTDCLFGSEGNLLDETRLEKHTEMMTMGNSQRRLPERLFEPGGRRC
jgi:hypothetical protein